MVFDNRIELLDDNQLVNLCREIENQLLRQRIDHAQLENARVVAEYFLCILVAGARCNHAEGGVAHLHAVKLAVLRKRDQIARALLDNRMTALCIARHHNILGNVLFIGFFRRSNALAGLNDALRMRHARAHLENNRRVKLLGKLKRAHGKGACLCRIRRLKHRNFRRNRVMARILLILRGMHARIVRHDNYHTGIDAGVGYGVQRVSRNIQADMLHAAEAARSCETCAERDLHGYLFIRRPFTIHFIILCGFLCDLRARSSRITGNHAASCLIQTAGNRLIAQHQLFHMFRPFLTGDIFRTAAVHRRPAEFTLFRLRGFPLQCRAKRRSRRTAYGSRG